MRPAESRLVLVDEFESLTEVRIRELVRQIVQLLDENDVQRDEITILKQRIAELEVTP